MTAGARRGAGLGLAAILAVTAGLDLAHAIGHWAALRPVRAGDRAPDLELPKIDAAGQVSDARVSLASLRGHPVVLDFWATWCGPCRQAMPVVAAAVAAHPGAILLSINTESDDQASAARAMVDQLAPGAELVLDDGEASARYRVRVLPTLVVVGRGGRAVWVERGFAGSGHLARALADALTDGDSDE